MIPKLKEFTKEELKEQYENGIMDLDFMLEYIAKRDKVYNELVDENNRLRIENSAMDTVYSSQIREATKILDDVCQNLFGLEYESWIYNDVSKALKILTANE